MSRIKQPVHTIVMHWNPHLDEIVALFILFLFGEEWYPGVTTAKWIFWGSGNSTPDGRPAAAWEAEGFLLVGVGGGHFDEHAGLSRGRQEGECAATLVAKDLEVTDDPALKLILTYVTEEDLHGSGLVVDRPKHSDQFELASLIKVMYHRAGDLSEDQTAVIRWALEAVEARYWQQAEFEDAKRLVGKERSPVWHKVNTGSRTRTLKLVTIVSDNRQIAKAGWYYRADLVIQRHPQTGNTQVYTNSRSEIDLRDVVRLLRKAEARRRGVRTTPDWVALEGEGQVPGVPQWYFHLEARSVMNGSLTARDVPPTALDFDEIIEVVKDGLTAEVIKNEQGEDCRRGHCWSSRQNPCPIYGWGLVPCRQVRNEEYQTQGV